MFFFKQETAYEMRISDWSSDVCSSELPVDVLFGFEHVDPAPAEAEGRPAHRFYGDVAGHDHQVGPAQLAAVFLLDRPEQAARLVQIGVVGPAVERREALPAGRRAAAPVAGAICARAVPGHRSEAHTSEP